MKLKLIGVFLLITEAIYATETNRLTRSGADFPDLIIRLAKSRTHHPLIIGEENDRRVVGIMERLESAALRNFFPAYTAYRLVSSRDPIHHADFSALLLNTNGLPMHLKSDNDVTDFLGEISGNVSSASNALQLVRLFADLRSYKIVEAPPDFKDARPPEKQPPLLSTDFKFVAEDRKEEWRVYATLFTSDYSGKCDRYVFTIYKKPGSGVSFSEPVMIRLENYVY